MLTTSKVQYKKMWLPFEIVLGNPGTIIRIFGYPDTRAPESLLATRILAGYPGTRERHITQKK